MGGSEKGNGREGEMEVRKVGRRDKEEEEDKLGGGKEVKRLKERMGKEEGNEGRVKKGKEY